MDIAIYVVLGVVFVVYAFWLNTAGGKKFADEHTWASVVIGSGLILAALWFLVPADSWQKMVLAFVVAGIPMIARSLLNKRA
ncbi:MAG: hypothetical protein GY805_06115 [Chloroflexi bacterium]|nr:hypothetical protein [Chloroflexota bacterium]